MRRILQLALLLLWIVPRAHGQGPIMAGVAPVMEGGVGFSYVQAQMPSQGQLGMNGVQAVLNADLQRHFGVKLDAGYSRSFDAFSTGRSADLFTYMAGPVFYPVRRRHMYVYAELLLGGARQTGVNFESSGQMVLGFVNKFAWAGGGGFQYRLTPSFSLRVGADYLRTAYFNSNVAVQGQSDLRSSICFIYTFGERE
jgi:opacity protein-like surface antigen